MTNGNLTAEQERQHRADICIKEVEEVFRKHKCHAIMAYIKSSNGLEKFELTAETDIEAQEVKQ